MFGHCHGSILQLKSYYQESGLPNYINPAQSSSLHFGMVSTHADFIAMKLRANGMEMVDIAESKSQERKPGHLSQQIDSNYVIDIHFFDEA
ncbi:MAG: hypothetical protein H0V82_04860 [Candidatus Protochlamydia sp.]|nr:hypothetical protein [Candidatus Protochlamydia sp.]